MCVQCAKFFFLNYHWNNSVASSSKIHRWESVCRLSLCSRRFTDDELSTIGSNFPFLWSPSFTGNVSLYCSYLLIFSRLIFSLYLVVLSVVMSLLSGAVHQVTPEGSSCSLHRYPPPHYHPLWQASSQKCLSQNSFFSWLSRVKSDFFHILGFLEILSANSSNSSKVQTST